MKNLLLATLTLFSFAAYSQTYAPVYIWKVSPDTVYQGDSVSVDFKFDEPVQNPKKDTTFMQVYDGVNSPIVWSDKWQNLYNYPKFAVGVNDSVYRVKIKVPINTIPGNCRVYGRGGSFLPFFVKAKTATYIKNNVSSGNIIDTRYFDLGGAELTAPIPNQIIIKVELYEDGSYKSTKSVTVL